MLHNGLHGEGVHLEAVQLVDGEALGLPLGVPEVVAGAGPRRVGAVAAGQRPGRGGARGRAGVSLPPRLALLNSSATWNELNI